jgi:hypothetical protein
MQEDVEVLVHYTGRIFEHPAAKLAGGVLVGLYQCFFGNIAFQAFCAIFIVWMIDFITGYHYARIDPAIRPCSRKWRHGLVKYGIYLILLLAGNQCYFIWGMAFVSGVIQFFIMATEVYSICENVDKISTFRGVPLPFIRQIMKIVEGKVDAIKGGDTDGK